MWYYQCRKDDKAVIDKLNELAEQFPTRGFDSYYGRIRAAGLSWNRKKVLRVYRMMKLKLRRKRKRCFPARTKKELYQPASVNQCWSADFMSDALANGRRIRIFNVIDDYNREALSVDAQYSYPAAYVIRCLEQLSVERGLPQQIRVDNGPEFISKAFQNWCESHQIEIQYIQPGKPTQNAYIERFNRLYREDILDAYLFINIEQVRILSEKWKEDYNNNHPHSSLKGMSPIVYHQNKMKINNQNLATLNWS
jgi:putative transposase